MKKKVLALSMVGVMAFALTACADATAPDYSQKDSWYKIPEITKDVDTFFIYPTEYMGFNEGDPDYAPFDNEEMREGAAACYIMQASAYEDSTNVFMPYYRQASLRYAGELWSNAGDRDAVFSGTPYSDITAALDYYFTHYNNGRPFIIAGHSQGSAITRLVLKKYFAQHQDYYKRMIAAYVIGYSVTKDDLEKFPHLKFATGESDTGVIISWNTEGRKNVEGNVQTAVLLPGAISINPLNWRRDDTYAPASENLGSFVLNEKTGKLEIADVGADAQVVPERGTLVTNAELEPMPEELAKVASEFFGPDGRHESDYSFYYNNIKANVAKRIAAYNARKAPDYSQKSSWYKLPEITKDVDTFYINSTVYIFGSLAEDSPEYASLDNTELLAGFVEEYLTQASAYEASTNVFVPYYRQAGMRIMKKSWLETGNVDAAISSMPYIDITSALDYYFENCNNGRPFIIAGHSQGAALVRLVLKRYFAEHPDYYKRMIAAYVIGYSVTKDDLEKFPHLKFATGKADTGVIVSWNTEGKENIEGNVKTAVLLPGAISINPINWKLDDTYAPATENLGSLVTNEKTGKLEIADVGADAQIVPERGTVLTNAKPDPMPEEAAKITAEYFGPGARHDCDYTLYYNNLKDNVAKRIAAFMAGR